MLSTEIKAEIYVKVQFFIEKFTLKNPKFLAFHYIEIPIEFQWCPMWFSMENFSKMTILDRYSLLFIKK